MATTNVILKFDSFQKRDEWVEGNLSLAKRVYTANPWVAAQLPSEQIPELKQRADVQVFPDVGLTPADWI